MSAASLLAAGQAFLAREYPATIRIGPQSYQAATSGLSREYELSAAMGKAVRRVSFWLPLAAFASAGQPQPVEDSRVAWNGAEYLLQTVLIDPTGTTCTLQCVEPPQ